MLASEIVVRPEQGGELVAGVNTTRLKFLLFEGFESGDDLGPENTKSTMIPAPEGRLL